MRIAIRPFRPKDAEVDAMGVFVPALLLVGLGLICVFSFGSCHLYRQASWAVLGVVLAVAASRLPLPLGRGAAPPAVAGPGVLLLCALLFAPEVKGTKRWLMVPLLGRFQPSELAMLAVVLWLAHRLSESEKAAERPFRAAWPALLLCGLVLPAPDLGRRSSSPRSSGCCSSSCTMRRDMGSPSPVPPYRRECDESACTKASKIVSSCAESMPIPVSITSKRTLISSVPDVLSSDARTVTEPCAVNLRPVPIRLEKTCTRRISSPIRMSGILFIDLQIQSHPLIFCLHRKDAAHLPQQFAQGKRSIFE